ncbi:putative bifunctional diguanylate cyclase/phosphodiesterase [Psychromarinibacter halotolerans]|uniref:Bifunctional diguanylate cyclase/phosphodiesterase n=1 Tax=Psychromarinibacter halotolerans TaxID=1775175 RepID=A0ABV7GUD6_9RHOB|nr:EAL domain-containing protein [Psychromarinibacter halotolerans]MDF0597267.1 EAL domain-containing protein [Psychromarinibacter halotolerans]
MTQSAHAAIRLPVAFIEELSRADSIEQVLSVSAAWLPRLIESDRSKLSFIDDGRLVARSFRRDGVHDLDADPVPLTQGSPRARVLESGEVLQIGRAALGREPDPAMRHLYEQGYGRVLMAPMRSGSETVGVVGLVRRSRERFSDLQVRHVVAAARWIGAQARLMQQLRRNARMAETDPLTGLANRNRLMRVLDTPQALHAPDSQGRIIGVLHVDLDHFKDTNDRLGHAAGDAALCHAARVMRETAGPADVVARIGGDEFLIVTRSDRHGGDIAALAENLSTALAAPMPWGDTSIACPASIGTALAAPGDGSAERLIANADLALYEVKRRGRRGVQAFTPRMRAEAEARRTLHAELRAAVDTESFEPHFQPIVEVATNEVVGLEVLARWPHPTRGLLSPEAFLDAAAEIGLSGHMDAIVRSKGLAATAQLRALGCTRPVMSVNLSAETLAEPDLVDLLLWEVMGHGLAPSDLTLEISETEIATDAEGVVEAAVKTLTNRGFGVAIDDFGTGHAALPKMRRLEVSGLNMAPAMTAYLSDASTEAILRAVQTIAEELRLSVTAKAVETDAALTRLRGLRCDRAQGFAISGPLPFPELLKFLGQATPANDTLRMA